MIRLLTRLQRDERGVFVVQFAGAAMMMLILLLGGFEMTRFVLGSMQASRVVGALSELAGAEGAEGTGLIPRRQMNDLLCGVAGIADQLSFVDSKKRSQGRVIVSGVLVRPNGTSGDIVWQAAYGVTSLGSSRVGSVGTSNVPLPSGITLPASSGLIVSEVYYEYKPIFTKFLASYTGQKGSRRYSVSYTPSRINGVGAMVEDGGPTTPNCSAGSGRTYKAGG